MSDIPMPLASTSRSGNDNSIPPSPGSDDQKQSITRQYDRESYIRCMIELILLRADQLEIHRHFQITKRLFDRGKENPSTPRIRLGPTQYAKYESKMKELERREKELKKASEKRLDYLSGASDVSPVHDVLFPGGEGEEVKDGEEEKALEVRVKDIERIIGKLKGVTFLPVDEDGNLVVDEDGGVKAKGKGKEGESGEPSAKKRKLDSGKAITDITSPSSPRPPLTVLSFNESSSPVSRHVSVAAALTDIETLLRDTAGDIQHLAEDRPGELQEEILARFNQMADEYRQRNNENEKTRIQEEVEAFLAFEQEKKAQSEEDLAGITDLIRRKEERNREMQEGNEELERMITEAERRLAEDEQTIRLIQAAQATQDGDLSAFLSHPYFIQLSGPLRQTLMLKARAKMEQELRAMLEKQQEIVKTKTDELKVGMDEQVKPIVETTNRLMSMLFAEQAA